MPRPCGVFTSGIVAETGEGCKIALFFTGRQHAGENPCKADRPELRSCATQSTLGVLPSTNRSGWWKAAGPGLRSKAVPGPQVTR